jgi:hypothetical protein
MIAFVVVVLVLFCLFGTRNNSFRIAKNTKDLQKIAALPEHVKEKMWEEQQFKKLPGKVRLEILRQRAIERDRNQA